MELQLIQNKIYEIRGHRVMLDFHLAEMYETETRKLKQAVKRNSERFPADFMFQLNKSEWQELITNCDNLPETIKFSPVTPFAFTEQGVAMLSSVLNSKKAIQINIVIIRAFVVLRQHLTDYKVLESKLTELETKFETKFTDVYQALNYLINKDQQQAQQQHRKKIGFNK